MKHTVYTSSGMAVRVGTLTYLAAWLRWTLKHRWFPMLGWAWWGWELWRATHGDPWWGYFVFIVFWPGIRIIPRHRRLRRPFQAAGRWLGKHIRRLHSKVTCPPPHRGISAPRTVRLIAWSVLIATFGVAAYQSFVHPDHWWRPGFGVFYGFLAVSIVKSCLTRQKGLSLRLAWKLRKERKKRWQGYRWPS